MDAALIASANEGPDTTIKLWNLQNDTVKHLEGHTDTVTDLDFSPDGQLLASSGGGKTFLWDIPRLQKIATFRHAGPQIAFSPDGQLLAIYGRHVTLFDVNKQTEIATLEHDEWVWVLDFSRDGKYLATDDAAGTIVKVWDIQQKQVIETLEGHTTDVNFVKFSPADQILASSAWGEGIILWDVSNWERLGTLPSQAAALDFSPDGKTLASAGWEQITLWSVETGERIATLPGHAGGWIWHIAFSADGTTLASGGADGIVRIQDIDFHLESKRQRDMVQQPANTVGVIYFLPTERAPHQDIDARIDTLIKDVQNFYEREMERNGFGGKTFRLQTDTNGKTVVHHINGKFNAEYYNAGPGSFDKILSEISDHIDISRNIYFIVADVTFPSAHWRGGGQAYLGSHTIVYILFDGDFVSFYHAGHELAHSFGLQHDFRFRTEHSEADITSYTVGIDPNNYRLSKCAAEWLDVHPCFNDTQASLNDPVTIEMLPPLEYPPNAISLRFEVTDPDGIHQAQLFIPREDGPSLQDCKSLNGEVNSVVEFITTELTARADNTVQLGIIDVHGNFSWTPYSIPVDDIKPVEGVIDVDSSAAAKVRIVSGNNQLGYLNSRLINPFVVTVRNADDEPVPGVQVTFQVVAGEGTLSVTNPWTDAEGQAQTYLALGDSRTEYRVTASVGGVPDQAMFSAAVNKETVATATPLKTLRGHRDDVMSVAYSPDGSIIATGSWDYTIRLWDGLTGEYQKTLTGHKWGVETVSFSPDSLTLASGGQDNTIRFWDVETGRQKLEFNGRSYAIPVVAYFPDGSKIASGTLEGDIHVWDAFTGQHITSYTGHTEEGIANVTSIDFNLDGSILASGGTDRIIRLWDTATGEQLGTIVEHVHPGHGDWVNVVFSHDGSKLASTGAWDLTARLWDTTGQHLKTFEGHTAGVYAIAFSPDNRTLATGSTDGEIRLWDTVTGSLEKILIGHTDSVGTLAFSPNANILVSGGADHTVNLWEITPGSGFSQQPIEGEKLAGDVNNDGVVNIQDLVLVAANLGETGQTDADVNGDGIVDIRDLVKVAGALGNAAAAPALHPQTLAMFTAADVQQWLSQAQSLNLTDITSQKGILFLRQLLATLIPKETALLPNYPNPFNPETWLPYQLAQSTDVTLAIYAANGQVVRTLELGHQPAGMYQTRSRAAYWDGRNKSGEPVASGIYFYTLTAGDFTATRKLLIRK